MPSDLGSAETADLEGRVRAALDGIPHAARVTCLRRLAGGSSGLTYLASLAGGDRTRAVVRVAPAGLRPVRNRDVLRQAWVMRHVAGTVPVPVVLTEDPSRPIEVPPFVVMEFVEGEAYEPQLDGPATGPEPTRRSSRRAPWPRPGSSPACTGSRSRP
ncbi:phosphotransferase [Pseudonocardia sp. RS010]|uniref:phosphotransferase n=1 Tax=Pseudonocardia sp. RS010 TaxID=3385979 RepID=UPI0039A323C8